MRKVAGAHPRMRKIIIENSSAATISNATQEEEEKQSVGAPRTETHNGRHLERQEVVVAFLVNCFWSSRDIAPLIISTPDRGQNKDAKSTQTRGGMRALLLNSQKEGIKKPAIIRAK